MYLFGFGLNALSLFGLVLAIGIVVDDAIVVVENVERNIANGLAPLDATRQAMKEVTGPIVAVTDFLKAVPDQIARWVPGTFTSLGTDGFGFSDTRPAARRFFHVDAESITLAVLWELARTGAVDASFPARAITRYRLDLPVSEALA